MKDGFRVCESSIQGNHLHLVCEADSNRALARGNPFSSGRYFDGWATAPPEADRESNEAPVSPAESWLLTVGWRRHGLIEVDEVPGPRRR
jgi:hypothetical protein